LLKLKAEAELARVEQSQAPEAGQTRSDDASGKTQPQNAGAAKTPPIDPKQIKAGYQKAIELVPRAVDQMGQAVKSLKQKEPEAAYPPAEQARKTLEEIQKAQPRQDQQEKNKKDEEQQKKDQQPKQDEQKKDQEKKDQQKNDRDKNEQQKNKQEQQKKQEPNKADEPKQDQERPQPQVSRDRIEEALRKVRERQQEKRERDRRMKARFIGRVPVEMDW
jgi:hypothetical protein